MNGMDGFQQMLQIPLTCSQWSPPIHEYGTLLQPLGDWNPALDHPSRRKNREPVKNEVFFKQLLTALHYSLSLSTQLLSE